MGGVGKESKVRALSLSLPLALALALSLSRSLSAHCESKCTKPEAPYKLYRTRAFLSLIPRKVQHRMVLLVAAVLRQQVATRRHIRGCETDIAGSGREKAYGVWSGGRDDCEDSDEG
eukprot:2197152-Rhodomonas_salina.2